MWTFHIFFQAKNIYEHAGEATDHLFLNQILWGCGDSRSDNFTDLADST